MPFLTTSNGEVISDDVDKANALNEFFTSSFNHKVHPLPSGDWAFLLDICTLNNNILSPSGIYVRRRRLKQCYWLLIQPRQLVLMKRMLKCTAASIALSINMSILTGTIPKEWKISSVVPIPEGKCSNIHIG